MNMSTLLNRLRFGLLIGALLVGLTSLARGATADQIEKSFTVTEGGHLIMNVDRGSIEVQTVPGNTLSVEVTRKVQGIGASERMLEDHHVEMTQEGTEVRIHAESSGGTFWLKGGNLQVRYLVTAPKKFNVQLKTRGGSITVSDLDGKAEARTSGGSLSFGEIQGPILARTAGGSIQVKAGQDKVDAETSGGSIKIGAAGGNVVAKTGGGMISISKTRGDVVARTSGGSIDLTDIAGRADASTSGGSVKASFAKTPPGDCTLKTSGGSVRVILPTNAAVDLDAKSNGGRVSTDFAVDEDLRKKKNSLQTKLNGGGPKFVAHTSGGSVHIGKH